MKADRAAILIVAAVLLALAGCSASGTLVVKNGTNGDIFVVIEGQEHQVSSGDSTSEDWDLDYFPVVFQEDKTVSYSVEGLFKFQEDFTATVSAQDTTTVNVEADAGAISITNNSTSRIYAVSIVKAYEAWGDDILTDDLFYGDTAFWRVEPGFEYDVLIYADSWSCDIGLYNGDAVPTVEADNVWDISSDGSYYYIDMTGAKVGPAPGAKSLAPTDSAAGSVQSGAPTLKAK